jgi:two-component system, LuxR family, sensor kinase FixL
MTISLVTRGGSLHHTVGNGVLYLGLSWLSLSGPHDPDGKLIGIDRLFQHAQRAHAGGLRHEPRLGVCGNEDERPEVTGFAQVGEQCESRHRAHAEVADDTTTRLAETARQEVFGRFVPPGVQTHREDQGLRGLPDSQFIVYNANGLIAHECPRATPGSPMRALQRYVVSIDYRAATLPVTMLGYSMAIRDFSSSQGLWSHMSTMHSGQSPHTPGVAAPTEATQADLFSTAPIPILLEDWSQVYVAVLELQRSGIPDIDRYFDERPEAVQELRRLHRFVDVNDAAVRLFEADSREHFLATARQLLPADRTSNSSVYRAMYKRETTCQGERTLVTFSGRKVPIIWRCSLPGDLDGYRRLFFYAFDVTEQKENANRLEALRAEMARSSRVSLFGELAASILHEISQPLSGVKTSSAAAQRWLERETPQIPEAVKAIRDASRWAGDATQICRKIRGFLGKVPVRPMQFDAVEVVDAALFLIAPEASSKGIPVETHVDAGLKVFADPLQIQQVLANLLLNGIHAIDSVPTNPRQLSITVRADGADTTEFAVHDTGCGVDSEAIGSLFQPFFTTKADGMGMGLAIVRSIVEGHGGRIWAESEPGQGTWFRFTLPASVPPYSRSTEASEELR